MSPMDEIAIIIANNAVGVSVNLFLCNKSLAVLICRTDVNRAIFISVSVL